MVEDLWWPLMVFDHFYFFLSSFELLWSPNTVFFDKSDIVLSCLVLEHSVSMGLIHTATCCWYQTFYFLLIWGLGLGYVKTFFEIAISQCLTRILKIVIYSLYCELSFRRTDRLITFKCFVSQVSRRKELFSLHTLACRLLKFVNDCFNKDIVLMPTPLWNYSFILLCPDVLLLRLSYLQLNICWRSLSCLSFLWWFNILFLLFNSLWWDLLQFWWIFFRYLWFPTNATSVRISAIVARYAFVRVIIAASLWR